MTEVEINLSNIVILNLFQDPSRGSFWARGKNACQAVCASPATSGQAEEWILKQVQDDEEFNLGIAA